MKARLWLLWCVCVIGCVKSHSASMRVWRAPGVRAPTYEVSGPGEPAFVERAKSAELRAAIESNARAQGAHLEGDGRLARLAVYAAEHGAEGRLPASLVEELARHFGLFDPVVDVILLDVPRESPSEPLVAALEQTLSGREFTHYGAALHADGEHTWLAIALSERRLALDSVPSVLAVNAPLRLRGVLPEGYAQPRIDVMSDETPRLLLPAGSEREFNVVLPTARKGTYRVEVLGDGPTGTVVLAKLPIYVGTKAPQAFEQLRSEPQRDPRQLRSVLVESIQEQRRAADLPSLVRHAGLDAIAERHCLDMRDHGFLTHESPRTGGPADRVRNAGLTSNLVLENILRGRDVRALAPGPQSAEQQNMLHRDVTHIGVGLIEASDAQGPVLLATVLFARLDQSLDPSLAEPNLLSELNAARARRGYPALALDHDLSDVARSGAQQFFTDPQASEQSVVDRTHEQLQRFAVAYSRVKAVLAVTRELTQVATLEPTLDPAARAVGIGIAQGERDGGRILAAMVVLAYPR